VTRLEECAAPVFARHETFHPRYGWFRKGVRAAAKRGDIFTREEAPVDLGVGKNMVRAIRFWGRAAKILIDYHNPDRVRMPLTLPSFNGQAIFDDSSGLDPYLELPGSLWILHWWMLEPICTLPIWWLALNQFEAVEFSEEDLLNFVTDRLQQTSRWALPVESSTKKDVDCFLRMYAPQVAGRLAIDDLLDCPFRELGLIEPVWGDRKRYRFIFGAKPTLPDAVVAYACLEFARRTDPASRSITTTRLTHEVGSPGRIFKLTEEALVAAIDRHSEQQPSIRLASVGGVRQLQVHDEPEQLALEGIRLYYRSSGHFVGNSLALGIEPDLRSSAIATAARMDFAT
jgi:hypothetical protein